MQLYNTLSNIERAELIQKAGKDRLTSLSISIQKFNTQSVRNHLFLVWDSIDVLGTNIYVATKVSMHNFLCRQITLKPLKPFRYH